jgi:TrmH family RNA methyltransferase
MLTKNHAKLIKSLQNKKDRNELGLFLVEGLKSVQELLHSNFEIDFLVGTEEFFQKNKDSIKDIRYEILSEEELEKVSSLESNNSVLAVVKQKTNKDFNIENEIVIVLDEIKDPGNLGTIIRTADWYGIQKIVLSENSVDFYNPKVISGTMGSFARVQVLYTDLNNFFEKNTFPVFGAYLNGKNIHEIKFPSSGILLMGNESKGISAELEKFVTDKITIPKFGSAESLNVGIATAIILDNWKK